MTTKALTSRQRPLCSGLGTEEWETGGGTGHPQCGEGLTGCQQARAPVYWVTLYSYARLVTGKARQVSLYARERAAGSSLVLVVLGLCAARTLVFCFSVALIRDLRHGQARITIEAPNGICIDKANYRLDHQGCGSM